MYEYFSSKFLDVYKDIDPQAKHKNLVMWQVLNSTINNISCT